MLKNAAARANIDQSTGGGRIMHGSCTVNINKQPAVRVGDMMSPHGRKAKPCFKPMMIVTGSCSVNLEGRPMAVESGLCKCGCRVKPKGTCNVFIGK